MGTVSTPSDGDRRQCADSADRVEDAAYRRHQRFLVDFVHWDFTDDREVGAEETNLGEGNFSSNVKKILRILFLKIF